MKAATGKTKYINRKGEIWYIERVLDDWHYFSSNRFFPIDSKWYTTKRECRAVLESRYGAVVAYSEYVGGAHKSPSARFIKK